MSSYYSFNGCTFKQLVLVWRHKVTIAYTPIQAFTGWLAKPCLLDYHSYSVWLSFHREEEVLKLSIEVDQQSTFTSRRSYIDRIKETTKYSQKHDRDIERILKETRELQLESNSVQESLHRTYAVLDETIFRYLLSIGMDLVGLIIYL